MRFIAPSEIAQFAVTHIRNQAHSPSYATLTDDFASADQLKDYCIPVNSYFPTPAIMEALYQKIPYALKYYPGSNQQMAELVCRFADIADPDSVIVGNGSTEIISWLNTLFIQDNVLVPVPSFGRWTDEPTGLGREVKLVHYTDATDQHMTADTFIGAVKESGAKNAVLCNPNNPTGSILSREEVIRVMEELTHLDTLVIDESFIDCSGEVPPTVKDVVARYPNAWVLKSLGKNLGLHGLRMGYAISHPSNIGKLRKHLPFWNVNGITEMLLKLVVDEREAYEQSRLRVIQDRDYLNERLRTLADFTVFPSHANFAYAKLNDDIAGDILRDRLLTRHQCFVRNCGNKIGCTSQYFRIASRPKTDVDYLIDALTKELDALKMGNFIYDMRESGFKVSKILA